MRFRVRQGRELLTEKASPKMCSAHAALSITAHHAYGSLISVLCLKQLFPPTESTGGRIRANFNNFHQAQSIVRPFIEVNTVWPVAFIFQISNSRTAEHPGGACYRRASVPHNLVLDQSHRQFLSIRSTVAERKLGLSSEYGHL